MQERPLIDDILRIMPLSPTMQAWARGRLPAVVSPIFFHQGLLYGAFITRPVTPSRKYTGLNGSVSTAILVSRFRSSQLYLRQCDANFGFAALGRVDGFDQDEAKCKSHERTVVERGFLAS